MPTRSKIQRLDQRQREKLCFPVIGIRNNSGLGNFGKPMPWQHCIRLAEIQKKIPPKTVTVAMIRDFIAKSRLFESHGIRRWEMNAPQIIHQVDFSGSKLLRAVDHETVAIRGAHEVPYSNRPTEPRDRVWVGLAVDDCSRVAQAQFYICPGESAELATEFMLFAWRKKPETIIHGIPQNIYTDQNSWVKTESVMRGLGKLGVNIIKTSGPGEPWKKGKVERPFLDVQRDFENHIATMTGKYPLHEINGLAVGWLKGFNERPHPTRRGASRIQVWQSVKKVKVLPTNARDLFFENHYRVAQQRQIRCEGNVFWAPAEIADGSGIDVFRIGKVWYGFDFLTKKRWVLQEAMTGTLPVILPEVEGVKQRFEEYIENFNCETTPDELKKLFKARESGIEYLPPPEEEFSIEDEKLAPAFLSGDALRNELARFFGPRGLQAIPDDIFELEVKDWIEKEHTEEEVRNFSRRIKELKKLSKVQNLVEDPTFREEE